MANDTFMLGALGQAITAISDPVILLVIVAGSLVAVIFGVLPGLNASMLAVLILPFVFTMDASDRAAVNGGGASSSSDGRIVDVDSHWSAWHSWKCRYGSGWLPDVQKRRRRPCDGRCHYGLNIRRRDFRVLAFLMIPLIVPLVMKFRSPELFCLIVAGLFFLATLTRGSTIKGLISAGLGILIACIGYHTKSGLERFTFGNWYLYNGIPTIVLLMAMFALPSLVELYVQGKPVAAGGVTGDWIVPSNTQGHGGCIPSSIDMVCLSHHWLHHRRYSGTWAEPSLRGSLTGMPRAFPSTARSSAKEISKVSLPPKLPTTPSKGMQWSRRSPLGYPVMGGWFFF